MPLYSVYIGADNMVSMYYPGYEPNVICVFPSGWHSCINGYLNPLEAANYPPLND